MALKASSFEGAGGTINLDSITGKIIALCQSNTFRTAVAAFLVGVVGPYLGLDQALALEIAGGISVITVGLLRLGSVKAEVAAANSGVSQEIIDLIGKVVGDVIDSKIPPTTQ
jgi:hypothetical protein